MTKKKVPKKEDNSVRCYYCSKKLSNYPIPFECSYCGNIFCGDHRLPESHDCELNSKKKEKYVKDKRKQQGWGEPHIDKFMGIHSGKQLLNTGKWLIIGFLFIFLLMVFGIIPNPFF